MGQKRKIACQKLKLGRSKCGTPKFKTWLLDISNFSSLQIFRFVRNLYIPKSSHICNEPLPKSCENHASTRVYRQKQQLCLDVTFIKLLSLNVAGYCCQPCNAPPIDIPAPKSPPAYQEYDPGHKTTLFECGWLLLSTL